VGKVIYGVQTCDSVTEAADGYERGKEDERATAEITSVMSLKLFSTSLQRREVFRSMIRSGSYSK
jgi:hypothetical protein